MACSPITVIPACPTTCNPTLQKCDAGTNYTCSCATPCPTGYECKSGSTICTEISQPPFTAGLFSFPASVDINTNFTLSLVVNNPGSVSRTPTVVFYANGISQNGQISSIPAGSSATATTTYNSGNSAGDILVSVTLQGVSAGSGTVHVIDGGGTIIAGEFTAPATAVIGEPFEITQRVFNTSTTTSATATVVFSFVSSDGTSSKTTSGNVPANSEVLLKTTFVPAFTGVVNVTSSLKPGVTKQVLVQDEPGTPIGAIIAVLGVGLIGGFILMSSSGSAGASLTSDSGGLASLRGK